MAKKTGQTVEKIRKAVADDDSLQSTFASMHKASLSALRYAKECKLSDVLAAYANFESDASTLLDGLQDDRQGVKATENFEAEVTQEIVKILQGHCGCKNG